MSFAHLSSAIDLPFLESLHAAVGRAHLALGSSPEWSDAQELQAISIWIDRHWRDGTAQDADTIVSAGDIGALYGTIVARLTGWDLHRVVAGGWDLAVVEPNRARWFHPVRFIEDHLKAPPASENWIATFVDKMGSSTMESELPDAWVCQGYRGAATVPKSRSKRVPLPGEIGRFPSAGYVAWSPDGRRMALMQSKTLRCWEVGESLADSREIWAVKPMADAHPCAFSHDGRLLAIMAVTGRMELRLAADGSTIGTFITPKDSQEADGPAPVFSPDDTAVIAGSSHGMHAARRLDGSFLFREDATYFIVNSIHLMANGWTWFHQTRIGGLTALVGRSWPFASGQQRVVPIPPRPGSDGGFWEAWQVAFDPTGLRLAVIELTSGATDLTIFSFPDLTVLARQNLGGKGYPLCSIAFTPCGRWLSVLRKGEGLDLLDAQDLRPVASHAVQAYDRLAFAPVGDRVAISLERSTIVCCTSHLAGLVGRSPG